jgi:squalene-hopene/tetraprenyl-beta-curcumene cyclase
MERAARSLLGRQHEDGYWWGNLTADTTLEADYLLLELWMHPPVNGVWSPPNPERIQRAVHSILERQLPDGGFHIYPQGRAKSAPALKRISR